MVHHNFKSGQKIYCILKDNTIIIDKYVETKGNYLILSEHKIAWKDLRSSTIYKNNSQNT